MSRTKEEFKLKLKDTIKMLEKIKDLFKEIGDYNAVDEIKNDIAFYNNLLKKIDLKK
jgi:hypothetical protein